MAEKTSIKRVKQLHFKVTHLTSNCWYPLWSSNSFFVSFSVRTSLRKSCLFLAYSVPESFFLTKQSLTVSQTKGRSCHCKAK